jgi:hypothetical protein
MPSTYDIGDIVTVFGTFTDTGDVLSDPTTVHFLYDSPTSTSPTTASRTSTDAGDTGGTGITKVSTGLYSYPVPSTGQGLYETRFTSTGLVAASGESWFSVRPQRVTT